MLDQGLNLVKWWWLFLGSFLTTFKQNTFWGLFMKYKCCSCTKPTCHVKADLSKSLIHFVSTFWEKWELHFFSFHHNTFVESKHCIEINCWIKKSWSLYNRGLKHVARSIIKISWFIVETIVLCGIKAF